MSMSRGTNNALAGIEGSVGGRVVRGQTWFFTALKTEVTAFDEETALAGSPFESRQRTTTLFGRVTHQIGTQHRLDGTLSRVGVGSRDALFDHWRVADPGAATTDDTAHFVWSARLASQVGQATHVELRANGENLSQEAAAVESPDLAVVAPILDLPLRTGYGGRRGCLGCDPSRRSVVTVRAAVNHLLSMDGQSHELTGGYETSGHRYRPVLDVDGRFELLASRTDVANGAPVPVLVPNGSSALAWFPNMDSDLDGRTHALFVGDRWRNLSGLTVDAGLRLEWRSLAAANGADVLNDWALSPRVQVAWAPTGPDAWMLTAAFSQYAGDLPWRAEDLSLATAPAWRFVEYGGPPLNAGGPVFSTPDTLALAAAWFAASGRVPSGSIVPGVSTVAAERSRAPQTTEWAAGVGRRLDRVELRTDLVYRTSGALRARLVTPGATVLDELGQPVDTGVPEPRDDLWRRNVDVTVSVSYRAGIQAQGGASYTISRLWGTADETVTDDPSQRLAFGYPQYFDADWATPAGDLRSDRRHRAVLWGTGQPIENDTLGRLTVGFLWRLESGGPFGSVGWIDTRPYVANPGVSQPPAAVPYYFTARDAFRVNVFHRVDLSVQFARPVPGRLRGEWFVRGDLLNLFNGVVPLDPWRDAVAVTALQDPTRFAPFNPFVEQPVEGVHWARDTRLESDSRALRTLPRSFRWLVGVRF
jgi:hypothetical protein